MLFPFTKQPDAMDCGPACLRMIAEHHGKRYTLERLRYAARVANIAEYIEAMPLGYNTKIELRYTTFW